MNRQVNAIAGRLSLRPPQRQSLEILDRITEIVPPKEGVYVSAALDAIKSEFPTVTEFERDFPSLCFALATGVGKTRLMGAFISYLHLEHGINHFFVLAPMAGTLNEPNESATGGLPMNELREGEGREKDSATETVRPRESPRGTRQPEPLLNQPAAAAESLRHRFLEADNQFYFRGGPGGAETVAFSDHGTSLTTEHEDPAVIHGMLLRAQAKGWTSLHVKGSDTFKAEAWIRATMVGIEVQGYHPREIDRVRLTERRGETPTKQPEHHVEQAAPRDPSTSRSEREPDLLTAAQHIAINTLHTILRARGDSAVMIAAAVEEATARLQGERLVVGTILEHGKAPYGHDKKAEQSYVVKIATAKGEKEVWGVDLARAMERSGAKIGDAVALIQRAHEPVTVQSPVKNEAGEVVGLAPQLAKRNKWEILNLQTIGVEARDRLTAAARVATHEPVIQVFDPAAARTDHVPDTARIHAQERTRAGR